MVRKELLRTPARLKRPAMQPEETSSRKLSGSFTSSGRSRWLSGAIKKTAGPTPCRLCNLAFALGLFLVYGFLKFGPRGEFRDSAGRDLDGRAGLWVAAVARLSL